MDKKKLLSKHQIIMRLIEISDENCISAYYFDPVLSQLPSLYLQEQLAELDAEGYIKKKLRHAVLFLKCYQYPAEHRKAIALKVFSVLGRPIGYLISWGLGILSSLLVEYLINVISRQP